MSRTANVNPGTRVYAVGWGFTKNNWFKASDDLKQVSFLVKDKETCGLNYVKDYQFCAGDRILGKDTCSVS